MPKLGTTKKKFTESRRPNEIQRLSYGLFDDKTFDTAD